jgi:peptide/nickel transport system permease protein
MPTPTRRPPHRPAAPRGRGLRFFFAAFALTALLADFLANDKPLACLWNGTLRLPVAEKYMVSLGLLRWPEAFHRGAWDDPAIGATIWPPITYHAGTLDLRNAGSRSPFGPQDVAGPRYRHWLGTDPIGRDVLAGLIHGTRPALLVGVLGTAIAFLIGLLVGGITGFFGDDRLRAGPLTLVSTGAFAVLGLFYAWRIATPGADAEDSAAWPSVLAALLLAFALPALGWRAGQRLDARFTKRRFRLPADLLGMRFVEAFQAMPGLLLLLALVPVFRSPSLANVVLIVGLIRWPSVARYTRGELLRIRNLTYIEAAELGGVPPWRLLWRHALPNALQPLLVLAAFGAASGVLLEAFLSFLGLGLPADAVTWGGMLDQARRQFSAWWLALFPGLAIFSVVLALNLAGEALQARVDTRRPYVPLR